MTLLWIALGFFGLVVAAFAFVSWRDAAYRRSGLLPAAGQATMADVERLVRAGQRILAIRCYRELHHVGLVEAKKAIDDLHIAA
jgi:ribosomal protein L7/L12